MHGAIFMSYSTQATLSLALLAAHGSSNTASKVHGEFDILRCTRIILILALRAGLWPFKNAPGNFVTRWFPVDVHGCTNAVSAGTAGQNTTRLKIKTPSTSC